MWKRGQRLTATERHAKRDEKLIKKTKSFLGFLSPLTSMYNRTYSDSFLVSFTSILHSCCKLIPFNTDTTVFPLQHMFLLLSP